jgi:hypothetical protein
MISRKTVLFGLKFHLKIDFILIQELYCISTILDQERYRDESQPAMSIP